MNLAVSKKHIFIGALFAVLFFVMGWIFYWSPEAQNKRFNAAIVDFRNGFQFEFREKMKVLQVTRESWDYTYPPENAKNLTTNIYANSPEMIKARQRILELSGGDDVILAPSLTIRRDNSPHLPMMIPNVKFSVVCHEIRGPAVGMDPISIIDVKDEQGNNFPDAYAVAAEKEISLGQGWSTGRACFRTLSGYTYIRVF